jgi:hypothetical protein
MKFYMQLYCKDFEKLIHAIGFEIWFINDNDLYPENESNYIIFFLTYKLEQ